MRDFRNYDIWKLSHELCLDIYKVTKRFPSEEKFGLTNQIRRASLSVPTNISEGCGRDTDADFNRFLSIAIGSLNETEYLTLLAKDLEYIKSITASELIDQINTIKKKTYTLKQKLTKQ